MAFSQRARAYALNPALPCPTLPLSPRALSDSSIIPAAGRLCLKLTDSVRNFPGNTVLWDSVSPASHSSSLLLSPTTLTHVGHTHRTTIPSLLSERHKLAPSGSPAGAVANPRPVPAVKTPLRPQPRVRRLLVHRSWSTSATANDED